MNERSVRRLRLRDALSALTVARSMTDQDHGKTFVLDSAVGFAITLPKASGSGLFLRFVVGTTITSVGTTIKVSNATDVMSGFAFSSITATLVGQVFRTASTDDTVTLNGGTTGGKVGDCIEFEDMKSGFWRVLAFLLQTATEATPFSATVS